MSYDISQDSIEYSKAWVQLLPKAKKLFNNTLNLRKPGDLLQDELCIDYPVTGKEKTDVMVLKYCRQNGIRVVLSDMPDEYISKITNEAKVSPILKKMNEQPGLGVWFTYVSPEGEETTISQLEILKGGQFDFEGYEAEFREAQKWVDEHPGSYIKSGDSVIYRGKISEILGQLTLLKGEDSVRASEVF